MGGDNDSQHSDEEAQRRIKVALRGAFAGAPTPLKHIPKKSGESRSLKRKKPQRKRARQRKNRAA
ncbi:MAG: hypothetical protein ACREC1_09915 [Methylovirgula sp.]